MQRTIANALLGLSIVTFSVSAFGGDWKFFPVRDANFKPDMSLSLVSGNMNPSHIGSGSYAGIELALNCLALQPPSGVIRTKISLGSYDHNGMRLTSVEINPRWTTNLSPGLTIGVGPGVGYVRANTLGQSTSMAALQIGADLDYRIGALNLGLGARWQNTRNKSIATGVNGVDNTLIQGKIGVNF
ncbi:MAG: hypothetical protein WA632_09710 [Gallionella sp.]